MSSLNVGNMDRLLRMTMGLTLIGLAVFDVIGAWGFIGVIPLATGVIATCPLYSLLGIRTTQR